MKGAYIWITAVAVVNLMHLNFNDVFGSLHLLQDEEGTIWFIGREVADKLGYDNSSAKGHAITRFVRKEDRKALKYKALFTADKPIDRLMDGH